MIDDSRLVQNLLETGIIEQDQLRDGLKLQKEGGASLYQTLIWNDMVEEHKLVALVADIINVPTVDLGKVTIPEDIASMVPASLAVRNRVLPLEVRQDGDSRELVLGMADPIDVLAMDEVATHTGIDIRPVLIGPRELSDKIREIYDVRDDKRPPSDDDLLPEFDSFDVEEVISDESWAEFFDEAQEVEVDEESSQISQEMRDRPTTGVLEVVEDSEGEEIEDIEVLGPLDETTSRESTSLSDWEVDQAITSTPPARDEEPTEESAEILTKNDAEELFASSTAEDSERHAETHERPAVSRDLAEMSEEEEEEADADDASDKTRVGVAPGDLVSESDEGGRVATTGKETKDETDRFSGDDELDDTGKTNLGVGASSSEISEADEEPEDDEDAAAGSAEKKPKKRGEQQGAKNTDYGALGRMILKGGGVPPEEQEEATSDVSETSAPVEDGDAEASSSGPAASEADAEDDVDLDIDLDVDVDDTIQAEVGSPDDELTDEDAPETRVEEPPDEETIETESPDAPSVTEATDDEEDAEEVEVHTDAAPDSDAMTSEPHESDADDVDAPTAAKPDPSTREMNADDLFDMAAGEAMTAGLGERTAAAEGDRKEEVKQLAGMLKELKGRKADEIGDLESNESNASESDAEPAETAGKSVESDDRATTKRPAITPEQAAKADAQSQVEETSPTDLSALAETVSIDLPEGVNEVHLVRAAIRLLVAQGILSKDALVARAIIESDLPANPDE